MSRGPLIVGLLGVVAAVVGGCVETSRSNAPARFLGSFVDDYGIEYQVTSARWLQQPEIAYDIVRWDSAGRFLIARNAESNPTDGGLWTRIDWVDFEGMEPYSWGFCLTVYDAATRAAAEGAMPADRAIPRSGCNGFPFSRMRRPETP